MKSDESLELLREAVRVLRILARPQLVELRERFGSAMLGSAKRRQMWELMDGNRSLTDISRKVGTSSEAVRQFLGDIGERWPDVIEVNKSGAGIFPRRLI